jgi:DNA polymerase-3 subunit gamma/tau
VLGPHLARIAEAEGARIDADALAMVARAAEGSVRDGLSLLDQAIVQTEEGGMVTAAVVRDMLGLADRAQTIGLFEHLMKGEVAPALEAFRALYGFGADPVQVALDLLDHCHGASIAKALGPDALAMPKDQAARLAALGANCSAGTLARVWQMLLKAHDEARRAPDPFAAVEMAIIRLAYAADLPGPEEALKALQNGEPVGGGPSAPSGGGGGGGGGGSAARAFAPAPQASAAPQMAAPQSFDDVVRMIDARRDIGLSLDVKHYMRPISFRPGAITFEPAPGAPSNLAGRLVARLKEWTGQPWLVAAEGGGGGESAYERERRERREVRAEIEADPFVASVMAAFPGAEIVEIRQTAAPVVEEAPVEVAEDEE